jgi:hypothetical protein
LSVCGWPSTRIMHILTHKHTHTNTHTNTHTHTHTHTHTQAALRRQEERLMGQQEREEAKAARGLKRKAGGASGASGSGGVKQSKSTQSDLEKFKWWGDNTEGKQVPPALPFPWRAPPPLLSSLPPPIHLCSPVLALHLLACVAFNFTIPYLQFQHGILVTPL